MLLYGARVTVLGTYHRNVTTATSADTMSPFANSKKWTKVEEWWAAPNSGDFGIRCSIPEYLTSSVDAVDSVQFFEASDDHRVALEDSASVFPRANQEAVKADVAAVGSEHSPASAETAESKLAQKPEQDEEGHPRPSLKRLGIIMFGSDIAVLVADWRICEIPLGKYHLDCIQQFNATVARLKQIDIAKMLSSVGASQKMAREIFSSICPNDEWRRVDRNAPKLPSLVNFAVAKDTKDLDDWFNLLTLTPVWVGSGTAQESQELRRAELVSRIRTGLLPDFWHHMPEAIRRQLLESGTSHAMADAANTALGVRKRNENTNWSVARVGRLSIVRAGAIQNAGTKAQRSPYLNLFYYDVGEITLKSAALVCAQRACLAILRQEVADVARKTDDAFEAAASAVQRKLARYATGYIHRSLGLAEQDEFIYRTWYDRLGIETELQSVTEDVNRLHQLAQASRQDKVLAKQEAVADATTKLSMIALLGSLGAVITGIFGMNMVVESFKNLFLDAGTILLIAGLVLFGSRRLMRRLLPALDEHMRTVFRGILISGRMAMYASLGFLVVGGFWQVIKPADAKDGDREMVCQPTKTEPKAAAGDTLKAPKG